MSTDSKSELEVLQEKELKCQQKIDIIESRLSSLKRVSNLLSLFEKCGAYIQDPNHNSILGLEDELRADKTELNKINEKIKQFKSTPTNSVSKSTTQRTYQNSSQFSFKEFLVIIVIGLLCLWGIYSYLFGSAVSPKYDESSQLYGFKGRLGFSAISPMYEDIAKNDDFYDDVYWVKKDGNWGAINKRGKTVIPFDYSALELDFEQGYVDLFSVINQKYGRMSKDGEILIPFEYDEVFNFDENNRTMAVKDGKVGVINNENEIVIPFEYSLIKNYYLWHPVYSYKEYGIVLLERDGKIGAINNKLETIIPFEYDDVEGLDTDLYNKGIIVLQKNSKWGVINKDNEIIIPFDYDSIYFLGDGFSTFKNHKNFNFDLNGNLIELY